MYFLSNSSENEPMLKENSYAKVGFFVSPLQICVKVLFLFYFCWLRCLRHFIVPSQELCNVFVKSSRKALRKKLSRYKA